MKATRIRIEFEDGSALEANGKQAADIMDWYNAGESMLCVHGGEYRGEKFTMTGRISIFRCQQSGRLANDLQVEQVPMD